MPKYHSKNGETVCTAPPTTYRGFHKGFPKKSFGSHITKKFVDEHIRKIEKIT